MGQTGNSLVIVFSIVLLLSLVVLSFETAEAQKDPDKDKKKGTTDKGKYPYVEAVVECRDGIYWLVFYSVYGPKQITIERFDTLEFMQEVASIYQSIKTQQAIVGGA